MPRAAKNKQTGSRHRHGPVPSAPQTSSMTSPPPPPPSLAAVLPETSPAAIFSQPHASLLASSTYSGWSTSVNSATYLQTQTAARDRYSPTGVFTNAFGPHHRAHADLGFPTPRSASFQACTQPPGPVPRSEYPPAPCRRCTIPLPDPHNPTEDPASKAVLSPLEMTYGLPVLRDNTQTDEFIFPPTLLSSSSSFESGAWSSSSSMLGPGHFSLG